MKNYIPITMSNITIEKVVCYCENCNYSFSEVLPSNYELVRFKTQSDKYVFLPTYGKNGYIELLKKLVKEWTENKTITPIITKKFEFELNKYTPYKIVFRNIILCPKCNNKIKVLDRQTEINEQIEWIKIDENILDL